MNKKQFEQLVNQAVKKMPFYFLDKMRNVAIVIREKPTSYQVEKTGYSSNCVLLGLYEGIPRTQRRNYDKAIPDKITLFQKNIEKIGEDNPEKINQLVEETIWHEIGHHFGLNEEEIRLHFQKKKTSSHNNVININQFQKIDLRIAKIIKAERIENTDKLVLLNIEVGPEERQLVAGIAENYPPETLIGKEIVIVANLEPRVIKGYVSQGMLLAAKNVNGPVLLVPDGEVASGSTIG